MGKFVTSDLLFDVITFISTLNHPELNQVNTPIFLTIEIKHV